MNDHDLLTRLDTKMDNMSGAVEKLDKKVDKLDEKVDSFVETAAKREIENSKRFLSSKTFYWVLGFVIACLIGAYGFSATIQDAVTDLRTEYLIEHTDK